VLTWTNVVEDELHRMRKFNVQNRATRDRILEEQGVGMCQDENVLCRQQLGSLLGVDELLVGELDQQGYLCKTHLVIMDVTTAKNSWRIPRERLRRHENDRRARGNHRPADGRIQEKFVDPFEHQFVNRSPPITRRRPRR